MKIDGWKYDVKNIIHTGTKKGTSLSGNIINM